MSQAGLKAIVRRNDDSDVFEIMENKFPLIFCYSNAPSDTTNVVPKWKNCNKVSREENATTVESAPPNSAVLKFKERPNPGKYCFECSVTQGKTEAVEQIWLTLRGK